MSEAEDTLVKEDIKLDVGVLKQCAHVWPLSQTALNQVKKVAEELFALRRSGRASDDSIGNEVLQHVMRT